MDLDTPGPTIRLARPLLPARGPTTSEVHGAPDLRAHLSEEAAPQTHIRDDFRGAGRHAAAQPETKAVAPATVAPTASQPLPGVKLADVPEAEWTMFVYLAANTHLDEAAHAFFNSVRTSPDIPKNMNVAMLVTGGEFDKSDPVLWPARSRLVWMPPKGTQSADAFEVDVDGTPLAEKLAQHALLQMHQGPTFDATMKTVRGAWPNTKVLLSIWSDGDAARVIEDDRGAEAGENYSLMRATNPAFAEGLKTLKPSVIVNDTCEARSLQVLGAEAEGAPHAVSVASEQDEYSWDYARVLTDLKALFAKGEATPMEVAKVFQNDYAPGEDDQLALALEQFPALKSKVLSLGEALTAAGGLGNADIASAYAAASRVDGQSEMDLGGFLTNLLGKTGLPPAAKTAAQAMNDELGTVGFNVNPQGNMSESMGVYGPAEVPASLHDDDGWSKFLRTQPPAQAPATPATAPSPSGTPATPSATATS